MDIAAAYAAHATALYRYLLLQCADSDAAQDILHDTFVRLAERPPAHARQLRAWLFRVALNQLRDQARASRRHAQLALSSGARTMGDAPPAPDRTVEVADARATLQRLLHSLPERDRQLLLLREAGLTQREMATVLGTTTGSVGTLLARALVRVGGIIDSQSLKERP